jgi:hypothetical protein
VRVKNLLKELLQDLNLLKFLNLFKNETKLLIYGSFVSTVTPKKGTPKLGDGISTN